MQLRFVAITGAALWVGSEIIERTGGGISATSLLVTTVAFSLLAIGVWGLDGDKPATRAWTLAVGALSLGFGLMAAVSVDMWLAGHAQHVEGPLFFGAVLTFTVGILSTGVAAAARHPRWLALAFANFGLLALAGNAAEIGWLASSANIALSLLMIRMATPAVPRAVPA